LSVTKHGRNETHKRSSSLRHPQRNSTPRSSSKSAFGPSNQRESRRQRAVAAAAAAANRSFRRPTYGQSSSSALHSSLRHPQRVASQRREALSTEAPTLPGDSIDIGRVPSISSPSPHSNDRCDELNCSKFGCKSSNGYDRHSSCEKRPNKAPRTRLTRQYWEQILAQRLFLFINCALFCVALTALIASCILDPRPLHHLSSRGGFFAFNSCIALFLALLGLYGVQRRQCRLLHAYASCCGCLLLFRLAIALAMLPSLSQFSLQLIALMCIALIELLLMLFATHLASIVHKLKRPPLLPDQTNQSTTTGASNLSTAATPIGSAPRSPAPLDTSIQIIYNERPVDVTDQLQVKPKSFGQDNPAFRPDLLARASPSVDQQRPGGSRRGANYSNNLHQYSINYDHLLAAGSSQKSTGKGSFVHSLPSASKPEVIGKPIAKSPPTVSANVSYSNQSPIDWQQIRSMTNRPITPQSKQPTSNSAEPPHSSARSRNASGALSTQPSSLNPSPALFRRETMRQSLAPESPRRTAAGSLAAPHTPVAYGKGGSADSGRGDSRLSTSSVFHSPLTDVYRNTLAPSEAKSTLKASAAPKATQPTGRTSIFDYNYTPINLSGLTSNILQKQTAPNSANTPKSSGTTGGRPSNHQRSPSVVYSQISHPNSSFRSTSVDQPSPPGPLGRQPRVAPSSGPSSATLPGHSQPAPSVTRTVVNSNVYSNIASSRSQIQINRMNFLSSNQQQSWTSNSQAIVKSVLEEEP
jgi:hypothetical protein